VHRAGPGSRLMSMTNIEQQAVGDERCAVLRYSVFDVDG
jgi:hypothetical protein